jgi:uncharacterized repeat protein (TIGR03847 family)
VAEEGGNFGLIVRIEAQSFGEPGQRTFRIWAASSDRAASLWLEKEQLVALRAAVDELLEAIGENAATTASAPGGGTPPADAAAEVDIHVGSLALGYDQQTDLLRIYAGPVGGFQSDPPAFSCLLTRPQMQQIRDQIEDILRSGRPLCPLCHEPIDPSGHACVRQNGHLKQDIPPLTE